MVSESNVDGGWAYAVALGNFLSYFLIAGFHRSFGIMYSAFLDTFRRPDSTTSLLIGIKSACSIVVGPLSTSLAERFTERTVALTGAVITSLSFIISYFANSLEFLLFSLGALQGIGINLMIGPSILSMGKYFNKKKSRAFTLTSCGGCIGMIVVPILLQKLIDEYSVHGALLIYGALSLHLLISAAVLRPLTLENREMSTTEYNSKTENSISHCKTSPNNRKKEESFINSQSVPLKTDPRAFPEDSLMDKENPGEFELTDVIQDGSTAIKITNEIDCSDDEDSIITKSGTQKSWLCEVFLKTYQFSLLKKPIFVIILLSGTLTAIPHSSALTYLVPLVESRQVSRDSAAILLSAVGGVDIIGRIVCGALADRPPIQPHHVIIVTSICGGILCCLFIVASGFYGYLSIIIAYGLVCSTPSILLIPTIIHFIGKASLSKAIGSVLFFIGLGTSVTPYLFGLLKDTLGSYDVVFPIFGGAYILAGLVLMLQRLVHRDKTDSHEDES